MTDPPPRGGVGDWFLKPGDGSDTFQTMPWSWVVPGFNITVNVQKVLKIINNKTNVVKGEHTKKQKAGCKFVY